MQMVFIYLINIFLKKTPLQAFTYTAYQGDTYPVQEFQVSPIRTLNMFCVY